jgi:centriolar protein POC1
MAAVKSIRFTPDGKNLISASDDKSIKIWDIDTLKFKSSFIGHTNWINSAECNSDMTLLTSGG